MDEMALTIGVAGAWFLLRVIGDWMIFRKAGKPGWHSIIPVLHMYDEYDICWKGGKGIIASILMIILGNIGGAASQDMKPAMAGAVLILSLWFIILEWKESRRLAWSFGKGSFFGLFLFLFGGLGRIILGLGGSGYEGKKKW